MRALSFTRLLVTLLIAALCASTHTTGAPVETVDSFPSSLAADEPGPAPADSPVQTPVTVVVPAAAAAVPLSAAPSHTLPPLPLTKERIVSLVDNDIVVSAFGGSSRKQRRCR